jgi:hypothetical protein
MLEEISMLDHLSHGRFEIGVGRGVSPYELGYHKVDHTKSREIFIDAYQCLRAGMKTDMLNYAGPYYNYKDTPIELPGTNIVFYQSPYVTQQANLNGHGIAYRTYIYMHQAVFAIFARVPGDTAMEEGDWRAIKVELTRNLKPSAFDPLATIGDIAGYRYHVAFSLPPDQTMRARLVDSCSAYS